jgi:hypothetical protein
MIKALKFCMVSFSLFRISCIQSIRLVFACDFYLFTNRRSVLHAAGHTLDFLLFLHLLLSCTCTHIMHTHTHTHIYIYIYIHIPTLYITFNMLLVHFVYACVIRVNNFFLPSFCTVFLTLYKLS